jgi:hypothetical protein
MKYHLISICACGYKNVKMCAKLLDFFEGNNPALAQNLLHNGLLAVRCF